MQLIFMQYFYIYIYIPSNKVVLDKYIHSNQFIEHNGDDEPYDALLAFELAFQKYLTDQWNQRYEIRCGDRALAYE